MSKQNATASIATLALLFFASIALAFVDPPTLSPANPTAGQTVSVSVRSGECDFFTEREGYPQVTQSGTAIRIVLPAVHSSNGQFCTALPGTVTFPVGAYPVGSYTLQVDRIYVDDINGGDVVETLGTLAFTVSAAAAQAMKVPAASPAALIALILAVLLGVAFARRKGSGVALIALAACGIASSPLRAQTIATQPLLFVLVSDAPGAPSPAAIIDYLQSNRAAAAPIQALAAQAPLRATYLLPSRAKGDFLKWLQAHPESARAKLERYLIVQYPQTADVEAALTALRKDPFIEAAYTPADDLRFSSVELQNFTVTSTESVEDTQYGRDALNVDDAWQIAGGYALVGDLDSGLATSHAALRQFSTTGQYLGGNFIPAAAVDYGLYPSSVDYNVDEEEPVPLSPNSSCNPQHLSAKPPDYAGHGTHVNGIIAGNGDAGLGVEGVCKHCGLAQIKIAGTFCNVYTGKLTPTLNGAAMGPALTIMADTGAQVVNMSFGSDRAANYCGSNPTDPMCLAITTALDRDIVLVGASGNNRTRVQFPGSDDRVIAVGGFDTSINLWDESPGNKVHCPYSDGSECGSNYTTVPGGPKQELMAAAKSVLSTTYPNYDWNPDISCGDNFGTPAGDGVGWCTGTSMAAPHVAGIAGLLRSINPLAPVGNPTFNPLLEKASIRSVLASTTFEAQANQPWSATFGYGRPDAGAAARKMIGQVAGVVIRNRATPLFRLYSSGAKDYADVTSPQYAISLILNQTATYQPAGSSVPGYSAFPIDPDNGPLPAPKAAVYVLTTEVQPRYEWPALVALYLMDKSFTAGSRDFMLVTTSADIVAAHNAGYNLRNIQGYIYKTCTPEPGCMPPGTQKFYRECKTADNDCATFLESEKSTFESAGYTSAYPSGSSKVLGYAYPAGDSDGDGLPNAFEYVVGTDPTRVDSDGDGTHDADEFPMVGVPVSDPCKGGTGAKYCGADVIFKNGYDFP
jgi:subtilisin family serine protease